MNLYIQIISLTVSFIYGVFVSITYNIFYNYLYINNKIYSFFNTFLYNILSTIIYFKLLYIINGGIINISFILTSILGFLLSNKIFTKKMSK